MEKIDDGLLIWYILKVESDIFNFKRELADKKGSGYEILIDEDLNTAKGMLYVLKSLRRGKFDCSNKAYNKLLSDIERLRKKIEFIDDGEDAELFYKNLLLLANKRGQMIISEILELFK